VCETFWVAVWWTVWYYSSHLPIPTTPIVLFIYSRL
jgi:hypothetical protein